VIIIELRQYTLLPGQRDTLIELFDREFVESQEELGMSIPGQFRDLDHPDRFVWMRGFPSMAVRGEALPAFYGGPVWKEHAAAANATMVDVDDVLLLRPVSPLPVLGPRPPVGAAAPGSVVVATIYHGERPTDPGSPLACYETLHVENNFPALPVRTDVDAFVTFDRFDSLADVVPHPAPAAERLLLSPTGRSRLR
jgi:NIPSNAP